jgi:glycosyltransferase involved in cell wall biosynthesis
VSARYANIIYVALGPHRIRAAKQYAAGLAADGAQVHLIVADRPEWAQASAQQGVTVHLVDPLSPKSAVKVGTHVITGAGDPRDGSGLIVAGDLQALPVAWDIWRRRPTWGIHFEPSEEPDRRPGPADLAVVTPWYPSPNDPFVGSFVKTAVGAVSGQFERVSVLHTQEWSYPHGSPLSTQRIGVTADRIAARWGNAVVADHPEGEVTRICIPVLVKGGREYAKRARAHTERLREVLPTGRIEAPLIHAHTGIYGGVAAIRLARPDARIVVTEHSSFLPAVFSDAASRRLYEEVLQRVDVLMCVSRHLHDLVSAQFPIYTDKLRVVSNVIDFDDFPVRPAPPDDLLRWLYVGRLHEQKGVLVLVEAFARVASEEPRATLTLVGSGELEDAIRRRLKKLGLESRVHLHPPVPPKDVAGLMHRHDVLVHASRGETFGMTVVEAVATGTPVLVARSQGPEETLAGLDRVAGLMFEISDDPDVITDAYRELRKRLPALDLRAARQALLARYGRESVTSQLLSAYRPGATAAERDPEPAENPVAAADGGKSAVVASGKPSTRAEVDRIVLVAVAPANYRGARDYAHAMLGRGIGVDLVTTDLEVWRRLRLDPRVRVHSIGATEHRHIGQRLERLLVYRAPGKVLASARDLARRSPALGPEVGVSRLQRLHSRSASAFHRKIFQRTYHVIRPRVLWRITRREVLPQLDVARAGRVVVAGTGGVAIGWQLARRHPHLTVTTSLSPPSED